MRFGEFELDSERGELLRNGKPLEIRPKPLALLSFLIRNRDRSVSKNEVLDHVWPEVVVSDTALSSALKEARRALGDDGTEQRFLRTARGRGYRFVHAVDEDRPASAPPAPVVAPPPLFGREAPLESLVADLSGVTTAGGLHAVVVSGPAGIGKTRLAEETLRRARNAGLLVYSSWCWEGEEAPAFWPWKQLLRELSEGRSADELEQELGSGARHWLPLIDESGDPGPATQVGEEDRFQLFDAIARSIDRQARGSGLAIGIDDLQWADPASLRLLQFLARSLSDAPILLICTIRSEGQTPPERVSASLAALARLEKFHEVELGTLELRAVAAWAEEALGVPPSPSQCRSLLAHSGGNPLFLRHLLSSLETDEGRSWLSDPDAPLPRVPTGIRDFIRSRLDRLTPLARESLRAGAVLGQAVQPDVIADALGEPLELVLDALDSAESIGLLTDLDSRSWRFAHGLVREALLAETPRAELARLHRTIGEALETLRCQGSDGPWWELAHHFGSAAMGGTLAKASDYAERAAEEATRELAFEEAETRYRRALSLLDAGSMAPDPLRRCHLLLSLGEAQVQANGPGPASRASCFEGAQMARELGAPKLFARAALGYAGTGALIGRVDSDSVELLEEALRRLPDEPSAERVYVTTRLGFELLNGPDRERARRLCKDAAVAAAGLEDPMAQATALFGQAWEQLGAGDPERPLELGDEVVRLAGTTHDLSLMTLARNLRIRCLLELGDAAGARDEVDALEDWVEEKRAVSRIHHIHARRAMLALMEGRLDAVRSHLERGTKALEGVSDPAAGQVAAVVMAGLKREEGDLSPFEPILRSFIEAAPQNWTWRCALADLYVHTGSFDRAAAEFERLIASPVEEFPRDGNWHLSLSLLAEVCAALKDVERAALLYDLLLPSAHLCVVGGNAAVCFGSLERRAGLLAALLGRTEDALAHYQAAVACDDKMGAIPESARARMDQAELLLGSGGDPAAAAALLDQVRSMVPHGTLPRVEARLAQFDANGVAASQVRDLT